MFYSRETGIDSTSSSMLLGMMVIVGVLRQTGSSSTPRSGGRQAREGLALRVMILLSLITAGASALLDNVTTILHRAAVTLLGV